MARSLTNFPPPAWPRLAGWLRRAHVARRLAVVLTVAATLSGIATYVVLSGWLSFGADVDVVLGLLYLDVILLLLLGALVARRLVQLVMARWQGSAGSRLHARLVGLFSLVAVAPAIVVAVFSVGFLHYGLEAWFNQRINDALSNSLNVAQSYLEEHKEVIRADALAMAADLNREGPALLATPAMFQRLLDAQAALRSLTEAIVFQSNGQVLARTGLSYVLDLERLSPAVLDQASGGDVVVLTSDTDDRVRALVRLDNFIDAYLFVGRFVDPRVLDYMDRTREVVDEYHSLELRRSGIQVTFAAIFGVVALLLLLAAVGVGLGFANRLATPIIRLIAAADRVRAGDLTASVPEDEEGHEIDHLSRAFNRMTAQLNSQRAELIRANQQLDQRRRFTEAVIGGVSAGVLGLDPQGRITLPNEFAASLIGCPPDDLIGRPLIAVIPEVAGLLAGVATNPERPAEAQLELHRSGRHPHPARARLGADGRSRDRRLRGHLRRHHRAARRPAQGGLGRDRPPHRARDQEPADPDPAVGRAPQAQISAPDPARARGVRRQRGYDRPPGRQHRPADQRIFGLRPDAGAGLRARIRARPDPPGGLSAAGRAAGDPIRNTASGA